MQFKKSISILTISIIVLSLTACLFGLLSTRGTGTYDYTAISHEVVKINGTGIYQNDSISVTAQGKASDLVTLVMGLPLLLISLFFANKGSFKAKLLLTGTLGYFLYTYMSYTFLWHYNVLFIVYVALMSMSLYAFILSMMSFDRVQFTSHFKKTLPVKILGGFQIFIAVTLSMLWLSKLAPSIFTGAVPVGLEHYTTLTIQGMDLGIVVPAAFLSGILLIRRKPFGYLLSSVILMKSITMLTAISAMMVNQALNHVQMSLAEILVFSTFNVMAIVCLILLVKNTNEQPNIR
ncbi:MAG: hypothetical protein H7Y41_02010 [Hyphomonadaceae bacterium]|nr:hypothetical protein [Clostridia bacterium]